MPKVTQIPSGRAKRHAEAALLNGMLSMFRGNHWRCPERQVEFGDRNSTTGDS